MMRQIATLAGMHDTNVTLFQLVEQYQAVSYGDALFSIFILLPLTNVNSWKYRLDFS